MTTVVAHRLHDLAETIADLKEQVRVAIATELGRVLGTAVRDVLMIALAGRYLATGIESYAAPPTRGWSATQRPAGWSRDHDPWDDPLNPSRGPEYPSAGGTARPGRFLLVALALQLGRWWLHRRRDRSHAVRIPTAGNSMIGAVAPALLSVLAVAADLLTATTVLDVRNPALLDPEEFDSPS